MIVIKHRVNTVKDLQSTSSNLGVEIDIRTFGSDLILQHEPFVPGAKLEDWLAHFNHQMLIVNLKEDGLESSILDLMENFEIKNFFFLDQSMPSLYKVSKLYPDFCAARISDIESIETVLKSNAGWVWFDSHSGDWDFVKKSGLELSKLKIKKCLMSPELQRVDFELELNALKLIIEEYSLSFDAVCTKYPERWL